MPALQDLLAAPASEAQPSRSAAVGQVRPAPSTPRMPNAPSFGIPSASIGALESTNPSGGGSALANVVMLLGVGFGAYMFGKSRGKSEASEGRSRRNEPIPGTNVTPAGKSLPLPARPAAKVLPPAPKSSRRAAAIEASKAPPPTLRSGVLPSIDYRFDELDEYDFGDYGAPTVRR